jgi:phage tail-like protein
MPKPLAATLPSVLQEDDFCVRLTMAFDDALAPILSTLDCLTAYFDPSLAPPDFVDWLAGWVGLEIDETWPMERRRTLVREAIDLYRIRGTTTGLARHVALYAGVQPEINESGGCGWSREPGTPLPGSPVPSLTVHLRLADPSNVDPSVVERIVRSCRPAHIPQDVRVTSADTAVPTPEAIPAPALADDLALAVEPLDQEEELAGVPEAVRPDEGADEVSSVEIGPGTPATPLAEWEEIGPDPVVPLGLIDADADAQADADLAAPDVPTTGEGVTPSGTEPDDPEPSP